jgi:hypothetical protein
MRTETKKHLKAAGCWLLIAKLKRGGLRRSSMNVLVCSWAVRRS